MKKLIHFTIASSLLLILVSCSNDNDDDANSLTVDENVTYTESVKAIIDTNCLNCHSNPPTNGAPMELNTYSSVKNGVENRNLIGRIENGTMPTSGTLTSTQIQAVKDWQTNGFLE